MLFPQNMKALNSLYYDKEENSELKGLRKYLHFGKITSIHGLLGAVKLYLFDSDFDRIKQMQNCFLVDPTEKFILPIKISITKSNKIALLKIQGIDTPEMALKLKNYYVAYERSQMFPLEENMNFICDLIGCDVYDDNYGALGKVSNVLQNSAHDVYVVSRKEKKDLLIPATKEIVEIVDIAKRNIKVVLPNGLYEIYDS